MSPLPERMTDHWWWRPGVRPGRHLYVWHILFDDQPDIQQMARTCQQRLSGLPGLDLVPIRWLHMTTQIIGFTDEITDLEIKQMTATATERLRHLDPVTLSFGWPLFHSEAVVLGTRPSTALDPVRATIRDAISDTVTAHQLADEPDWTPHVTVAYSNSDGPAAPIIQAMTPSPRPCPLTISKIHLIDQERIDHLYCWTPIATATLGPV